MLRYIFWLTLTLLPGCGQAPQPVQHADAETITRAVQHAQKQAERPRNREIRK